MTKTYYTPWDATLRWPAQRLEYHASLCLQLKLPATTPPNKLPPLEDHHHTVAEAAANKWQDMTSWSLSGLNDGEPVLAAMESGFYEYLFLFGGRAGGKSHEVAEALVDLCSRVRKRVVCGREFQNSIRDSSHALLVSKIKAHATVGDWKVTDNDLRHKNGTLITFMGLARNPDSAKSLEGCDIFWGEEAQTFSATSVEILLPTIREHGSMLIFTANPRFEDDPVPRMAMIEKERPEAIFYKVMQFEDNPYLYRSRLMNDLRKAFRNSKRFKHVWRGDLDRNGDLQIISHTVGVPPVPYPQLGRVLHGVDFGGTDPTAYTQVTYFPPEAMERGPLDKGVLYIDREFVAPCASNRDIVQGILAVSPELVEGSYELKGDSADPKAIGELNAAGIPTRGAVKGEGSVLAGLRAIADHDVWIHPDCTATVEAASNYRWKADRNGKPLNVPAHPHSHVWDGVRYAIEGEDLNSYAQTNGGVVML